MRRGPSRSATILPENRGVLISIDLEKFGAALRLSELREHPANVVQHVRVDHDRLEVSPNGRR